MRKFFFSFLCLQGLFLLNVSAQGEPIQLINPSFDGLPTAGSTPRGWEDCGFPGESPPDVHTGDSESIINFKVIHPANDGNTFLGMVVRDNDTWERVSQRLSVPMEAGQCYDFSLYLARADTYESLSQTTQTTVNFAQPIKLRIWGGSSYCDDGELLAQTNLIKNTRWLRFDLHFEPSESHRYIMLEAYYQTPSLFAYNGNILLDNLSSIIPVPCDAENPIAMIVEEPQPAYVPDETGDKPDPGVQENPPPKPAEDGIMTERLSRENLTEGAVIQIDELFFEADSSAIKSESYRVLDEIYRFLNGNRDVIVEIGGHTNDNPPHEYCDRLSTARAKAVADYLSTKGIESDRLQFKGYGKRKPIASNKTPSGRKRNQRVEIKILNLDG